MNLSSRDKEILQWIQHRADMPLSAAARHLRIHENTLRRFIDKLKRDHIIRKMIPVDQSTLGRLTFNLLFSLRTNSQKAREELIAQLVDIGDVGWAVEVGGEYQYEITFTPIASSDAGKVITQLSSLKYAQIQKKDLVLECSQVFYGLKFNDVKDKDILPFQMCGGSQNLTLDETDHRVAWLLSHCGSESINSLAKANGIPASTLTYRKQKLEKLGVILPGMYSINTNRIGYSRSHILVSCGALSAKRKEALYTFCKKTVGIYAIIGCVGAWDYKIVTTTPNQAQLKDLLDKLHQEFENELLNVRVVPCFDVLRLEYYPAHNYRQVE